MLLSLSSTTMIIYMEILSAVLAMYARDSKPWRGGSRPGQCKSKPRQRLDGYYML
jgi:hypothetical protein